MDAIEMTTGSEKQITWANALRRDAFAEWERDVQREQWLTSDLGPILAAAIEMIASITDAKWWIDHRVGSSVGIRYEAIEMAKAARDIVSERIGHTAGPAESDAIIAALTIA